MGLLSDIFNPFNIFDPVSTQCGYPKMNGCNCHICYGAQMQLNNQPEYMAGISQQKQFHEQSKRYQDQMNSAKIGDKIDLVVPPKYKSESNSAIDAEFTVVEIDGKKLLEKK